MASDRWLLIEGKDGQVQVMKNRRAHSRHPSVEEAQRAVGAEMGVFDRVVHQEPDGYRVQIGRQVRPRKGWRQ